MNPKPPKRTTNNQLIFQPGKFYLDGEGNKSRIYADDGLGKYPIHGATFKRGKWRSRTWTKEGRFNRADDTHSFDLIAEWKDAPSVDWSKMPAWANWVALDGDGSWFWYMEKPELGAFLWRDGLLRGPIPDGFAPKWTGDWRESLVTREETK